SELSALCGESARADGSVVMLKRAVGSAQRAERGAVPSPDGRRWREAPDEGRPARTNRDCGESHAPHPPLRGTLSRWERDCTLPALCALRAAHWALGTYSPSFGSTVA